MRKQDHPHEVPSYKEVPPVLTQPSAKRITAGTKESRSLFGKLFSSFGRKSATEDTETSLKTVEIKPKIESIPLLNRQGTVSFENAGQHTVVHARLRTVPDAMPLEIPKKDAVIWEKGIRNMGRARTHIELARQELNKIGKEKRKFMEHYDREAPELKELIKHLGKQVQASGRVKPRSPSEEHEEAHTEEVLLNHETMLKALDMQRDEIEQREKFILSGGDPDPKARSVLQKWDAELDKVQTLVSKGLQELATGTAANRNLTVVHISKALADWQDDQAQAITFPFSQEEVKLREPQPKPRYTEEDGDEFEMEESSAQVRL
jgi:hypothetical protein